MPPAGDIGSRQVQVPRGSALPTVNAVWFGTRIGQVHAACVRSFVRQGHRVILHALDAIEDVPAGVELFDASRLMSRRELESRRNGGSLALVADIYRLRLLAEGMGLYVDCDVFCLKPFPDDPYLFGWEKGNQLNNAVLRLPRDSELLRDMLSAAEDPTFVPFWESRRRRFWLNARRSVGLGKSVTEYGWGTLGPRLLTQAARRLGLESCAKPIDYFYPMASHQRSLLHQAGLTVSDLATTRTLGLHLYFSGDRGGAIQPGSPLDQIVRAEQPLQR